MKTITKEQHILLLERNCNKGKHRLRTNQFGVTWCVICGKLANGDAPADNLKEEDKIRVV